MRKVYFLGHDVKKISVTRSDHEGPPIEKRKFLVDLSPPLTIDTVLHFGLKEQEDQVKETAESNIIEARQVEEVPHPPRDSPSSCDNGASTASQQAPGSEQFKESTANLDSGIADAEGISDSEEARLCKSHKVIF